MEREYNISWEVAAKNGIVYLENNSDSTGGILEVKLNKKNLLYHFISSHSHFWHA